MIEADDQDKARKKKKTPAAEKVRQMLLKGKAKGRKKIPEHDRFYLEIFLISAETFHVAKTSIYMSKNDRIGEAARFLSFDKDFCILAIVQRDESEYFLRRMGEEVRCVDSGLKQFERIIIAELP